MKIFIAILLALITCCLVFFFAAPVKRPVSASLMYYFDLNQFAQYCPPTTALTYSAGFISGTQNGVIFSSLMPNEPAPQKLTGNVIQNVQPYEKNGAYGYQTGNRITCFYQYKNSSNSPVYLIMNGLATN